MQLPAIARSNTRSDTREPGSAISCRCAKIITQRGRYSFVESSGDAQELLAEVDLLSEASSCLLRSSSACSSELSSEAVAVDLADVTTSEWSDVAEESDVEQELS